MSRHHLHLKAAAFLSASLALLFLVGPVSVAAGDNTALRLELLRLGHDWEHVKLSLRSLDDREREMAALAERAAAIAKLNRINPEPTIWLGVIIADQASLANENGSPIKAFRFARSARAILEDAEKNDPVTMNAGAAVALGELFNRVPGFPIGFGDRATARRYFEEALTNAPDGFNANYFYGAFLFEQGDYADALRVLTHALSLPPLAILPAWDKSRREVIEQMKAKIQSVRPK